MRIVSWNTNSWKKIRNYQPWFSLNSWSAILEHIGADVVCLQETKLTRKQAVQDRQMCLPDDATWESFWDFHPSRGYSGTATYVKKSTVGLPAKAEYGLTGRKSQGPTVPNPGASSSSSGSAAPSIPASNDAQAGGIGGHPTDCRDELDDDLFKSLDEEGRCVIVDFGLFVLFNLYCPVMSSSESPRFDFRNAFHQCLDERARKLLAQGREVIIVGDINIARQPIDHCDYTQSHSDRTTEEDKECERQAFYAESQARGWFDTFLKPRGPFHDVQREVFPKRVGMYTCWSTLINARPANYGTRIDYTLVSPGLRDWVKGADIQADVPGSDHCPVYVDLHDEREIDGKVVKLKDLLSNAKQPPPLAASRWEEFNTKSLKSFFSAGAATAAAAKPAQTASSPGAKSTSRIWQPPPRPSKASADKTEPSPQSNDVKAATSAAIATAAAPSSPSPAADARKRKASASDSAAATMTTTNKKKQLKLGSFFTPPASTTSAASNTEPSDSASSKSSSNNTSTDGAFTRTADKNANASSTADANADDDIVDWDYLYSLPDADAPTTTSNGATTNTSLSSSSSTAAAWSSLFTAPPPPLCTLHSEPCKSYRVNKRDSKNNYGRQFWLCSRNVGPNYEKGFGGWEGKGWGASASSTTGMDVALSRPPPPEADEGGADPRQFRCGFFMWHSDWEREWRRKGGGQRGRARASASVSPQKKK